MSQIPFSESITLRCRVVTVRRKSLSSNLLDDPDPPFSSCKTLRGGSTPGSIPHPRVARRSESRWVSEKNPHNPDFVNDAQSETVVLTLPVFE